MCFGVKDAIALALATARRQPLTILGDLCDNETVLAELRASGIRIEQSPANVATPTVMITAHGAAERKINETRQRGLQVLEATCPLQAAVSRLDQRTRGFEHLQSTLARLGQPTLRGAMRGDHHRGRGHIGGRSSNADAVRPQFGQHGFVVDQVAQDGQRLPPRRGQRQGDGVSDAKTHAQMFSRG